jgi:tRNA pseudouridine32 synthase/23S rRNA pseudouridine746 synthase
MHYMMKILFENNDIVVADKPVGLACIAERDMLKDNLHAQLSAMYPHKIFIVHRLDKEASGVVLFAKNAVAHRCLCRQFAEHTVEKTYLALVQGNISSDTGRIDKPLRQFGSGRVSVDMKRGKLSVTLFEVVERFNGFTLVHAHPVTGRRHQLRVHFYSIGHTIVGDPLYGLRVTSDERPFDLVRLRSPQVAQGRQAHHVCVHVLCSYHNDKLPPF